MDKILTQTGIVREKLRKEMKDKQERVYADTDSMDVSSSYPSGEGFRLSAVGPSFKLDLGEMSRDEFWRMVDFICKMKGWYDGEEEDW